MEVNKKYFSNDLYRTCCMNQFIKSCKKNRAIEQIEVINNIALDLNSLAAMTEAPLTEIPVEDTDGRISLAYEQLTSIPKQIAKKFAFSTSTLDISYNDLKELSFLKKFSNLTTLILDRNIDLDITTLPLLPSLKILWLNNCNIINLPNWINEIKCKCPQLQQLSLVGNPGVRSILNGATQMEHQDYRKYIIGQLENLIYLDDTRITAAQRQMAIKRCDEYLCMTINPPLLLVTIFDQGKSHLNGNELNRQQFKAISDSSD